MSAPAAHGPRRAAARRPDANQVQFVATLAVTVTGISLSASASAAAAALPAPARARQRTIQITVVTANYDTQAESMRHHGIMMDRPAGPRFTSASLLPVARGLDHDPQPPC
jgi:hypothetical protein